MDILLQQFWKYPIFSICGFLCVLVYASAILFVMHLDNKEARRRKILYDKATPEEKIRLKNSWDYEHRMAKQAMISGKDEFWRQ